MIENHTCPACKWSIKMWLPLKINVPPISACDNCGEKVDFTFVYERRGHVTETLLELEQLAYLKRKYEPKLKEEEQ